MPKHGIPGKKILGKKEKKKRKGKRTSQKQFLGKIPLPADIRGGGGPWNYPCSRE